MLSCASAAVAAAAVGGKEMCGPKAALLFFNLLFWNKFSSHFWTHRLTVGWPDITFQSPFWSKITTYFRTHNLMETCAKITSTARADSVDLR